MSGHNHINLSKNMHRCDDYIRCLEEERRKIQVFERELPLCLELVTQAIETCKQQLSLTTTTEYNLRGKSECSEHTVPGFEEFIPIKRTLTNSDDEEHESKKSKNEISDSNKEDKNFSYKESDWLKMWNQTPDPPEEDGDGRAFHSFNNEICEARTHSTAENGGGNKKELKEERKTRRCWSPELHRRFLQALQELGGSHVATPKQIRELMKVDGLTNDEVKSHLQKYRLHTRRPSPSNQNNNAQTPQFVVVGGLWVPPEYASMAKNTKSTEAGIAAPPPRFQEQTQHIKPSTPSNDSYSKGGAQSCSPASSSSTHTTTAVSPAC